MLRIFAVSSLVVIALGSVTPAQAGGLWITEFGQPTQGRVGAGEEAGNGDATDAFLNPAAMTRLDKSEIMVSVGVILPSIRFDVDSSGLANGDNNGGQAAGLAPGGGFYYARPLNEKWSAGLSAVALTGSVLDYNDEWVGRYQVQDVSILVIGLVPALAYKVTDKFSLGVAVPMMYSNLEMDVAVPNVQSPIAGPDGQINIDGDDFRAAGMLSFLYEFSERTRLGGRVTSKFDFKYDGKISAALLGEVGASTQLTLAAVARLGLSHDFNDKWSGYATVGWDDWSEMGDIFVSTNTAGATLARDWDDTYHYSVGADYRMDPRWTLRAGVAYDTSPTHKDIRTADMPIDRQIRYAIGADYVRDSGTRISASLVYADYGDSKIVSEKALPVFGFSGKYKDNQILFATVSFNRPFGKGSR